jgi:hypothetical protein
MKRKGMKDALAESLKAEDESVRNRFEKAESLLGSQPKQSKDPVAPVREDLPPKTGQKKPVPRINVVRDSFTLPEGDYEKITELKGRCLGLAKNVNKSEIVRAGLYALEALSDASLLSVVEKLEKVKTGRPSVKE